MLSLVIFCTSFRKETTQCYLFPLSKLFGFKAITNALWVLFIMEHCSQYKWVTIFFWKEQGLYLKHSSWWKTTFILQTLMWHPSAERLTWSSKVKGLVQTPWWLARMRTCPEGGIAGAGAFFLCSPKSYMQACSLVYFCSEANSHMTIASYGLCITSFADSGETASNGLP